MIEKEQIDLIVDTFYALEEKIFHLQMHNARLLKTLKEAHDAQHEQNCSLLKMIQANNKLIALNYELIKKVGQLND